MRKAISKKARFEIFKRDDFTCQYCGDHPPNVILHIDHINPVKNGGQNDSDNLVTSCSSCNLGKGAELLSHAPKTLAEKAKEIAEREQQLLGYQSIIQSQKDRLEEEAWKVVDIFTNENKIDRDWFRSIKTFIQKLGVHEVLDAMELATSKIPYQNHSCFKYFCGVCWKKIKDSNGEVNG